MRIRQPKKNVKQRTPEHDFVFSTRINMKKLTKRQGVLMDFVFKKLDKLTRKELFFKMAEAYYTQEQGQDLPEKAVIVESSIEELMILLEGVIDGISNLQAGGATFSPVSVERVKQKAEELWDTSHLGKEGFAFDD